MKHIFYIKYGILTLLLSFPGVFYAQAQAPLKGNLPISKEILQQKTQNRQKLSANLQSLQQMYQEQEAKTKDKKPVFTQPNDLIQVYGEYVVVEFTAATNAQALKETLEKMGLQKGAAFGGMVSGLFPISQLDQLQTLPDLRKAVPAYKPHAQIGSVTSQGDSAQASSMARAMLGVNGTGTKIGVLSDSYDALDGEAAGIAGGDLPGAGNPFGFTSPVDNLLDLGPGEGSDEGRAMLEIIHDIAPGAELAFNTAFLGQAGFAQGILDLAAANCNVIVDDIIYFAEPMFQDGIIAQAADQVSGDGVPYFSAAGNNLRNSYESPFRNAGMYTLSTAPEEPDQGGLILGEYRLHDFDPGPGVDVFQKVSLNALDELLLSFQWDSPSASACSGCPGSQNDLDIFIALRDNDLESMFVLGYDGNIDSDPVEIISANNGDLPVEVYIVIGQYIYDGLENPMPGHIKYVNFGSNVAMEHFTFSSTNYGHSNATQAIATGGVRYDATPAFGVNPPALEIFSSAGGTPIFFDAQGNRISTMVRQKPEICAPQGGNTTFFGSDYEGDGFPNFFGTSASAPHAAGVAALMLEAAGNLLAPQQILSIMKSTAIDMDDPFTPGFDTGFDFGSGYGLIQAKAAIEAADQFRVTAFTLMDADADMPLMPLGEGERILLSSLPTKNLSIRATTYTDTVGSVYFQLTGEVVHNRTENQVPYASFGDFPTGNYQGKKLGMGAFTLGATPYEMSYKRGKAGLPLSVSFELIENMSSFTLVDAAQDVDILDPLTDFATIDLSEAGDKLNIRANTTDDSEVQSVRFVLKDFFTSEVLLDRVENTALFAMVGNTGSDYKSWTPKAETFYLLTATPYSEDRAGGITGEPLSMIFFVTAGGELAQGAPEDMLTAYPNPLVSTLTVDLHNGSKGKYTVALVDNQGKSLYETVTELKNETLGVINLNQFQLKKGMYYLRIKGPNGYRKVTPLLKD